MLHFHKANITHPINRNFAQFNLKRDYIYLLMYTYVYIVPYYFLFSEGC
jgi:hypothetical protein